MKMPTFDQLILPTLKALESLGGSGSIEEIANEAMQSKGQLSREQIDALIRANAKCKPNDPRYNS